MCFQPNQTAWYFWIWGRKFPSLLWPQSGPSLHMEPVTALRYQTDTWSKSARNVIYFKL